MSVQMVFTHSASAGGSPPVFDAATSSTTATTAHTTSGSNRLLLVAVFVFPIGSTATGVTYNGVAMTLKEESIDVNAGALTIWYLVAPATGSNNVVISPGTGDLGVSIVSYTGVNQSTPLGTAAEATGNGATYSVDVSSASGELVFAAVGNYNAAMTVGAGQTDRVNTSGVVGQWAASDEAGAATVTMSWTAAGADYTIIGVPLKPV